MAGGSFSPNALLNTYIDNNTIQLASLLGIGAYGIVYLGCHVHTGKRYAVKLITHKRKECLNEAILHSRVADHPNILGFKKAIRQGPYTFIILEYAPQGDLFTSITSSHGNIVGNNEVIRCIFLQIIDAVQHCHQRGVSHRDLKPENILMFPNRRIKLADFGLATTQAVSADFSCGSTFYFSPECQGGVVRNHKHVRGYSTQQNDVWSLGVILINLTAGRNPWKQATMTDATFAAYVRNPHRFFKTILPCISDELDCILNRIFCLDPAFRISLPELRMRILTCKSFTCQPSSTSNGAAHYSRPQQHQQPYYQQPPHTNAPCKDASELNVEYSRSTALTMLQYITGYIDDDDSSSSSCSSSSSSSCLTPAPAPPTPSASASSCSSSDSCPTTPRIVVSSLRKQHQVWHVAASKQHGNNYPVTTAAAAI